MQKKRWSQGELDECHKQVAALIDQGWIVSSSASHATSARLSCSYGSRTGRGSSVRTTSGPNAITQRSVEPLQHINQLVEETRGACFFTKLDLAMAYMQYRICDSLDCEEDQHKTSFRVAALASSLSVLKSHFKRACIGLFKQLYRLCKQRFVHTIDLQIGFSL
jgi:hypothetical protein